MNYLTVLLHLVPVVMVAAGAGDIGIGLYLQKFYGWYAKRTGATVPEVMNQVLLDFALGSWELMDDEARVEILAYLRGTSTAVETPKS